MWPLNVSLVVLSGVVLYLVFSKLRFDDPRLIYSGRFYVVAVPAAALTLAALLRGFASHYVQKSAQLGFLLSVTVHLLLLVIAFQWVIFRHYHPEFASEVRPDRAPVRHTVPEYLFEKPREPDRRPDWSRPAEAEAPTRSLSQPPPQREPSPTSRPDRSAPDVEPPAPTPPEPESTPIERVAAASSLPNPSDAQARLRPRQTPSMQATPPAIDRPEAPALSSSSQHRAEPPPERETPVERRTTAPAAERPLATAPEMVNTAPAEQPLTRSAPPEPSIPQPDALPSIREPERRRSPTRRSVARAPELIGTPPERPTVAVAREQPEAERLLDPHDLPAARRTRSAGATVGNASMADTAPAEPTIEAGAERLERASTTDPGERQLPEVVSSPGDQPATSGSRSAARTRFSPLGVPSPADVVAAAVPSRETSDEETSDEETSDEETSFAELSDLVPLESVRRHSPGAGGSSAAPADVGDPTEMALPEETSLPDRRTASESSAEQPRVAASDRSGTRRAKRRLDRPRILADSEVTPAKPFEQRVQRTQKGASPTSSGTVGPATEEAIERGLTYLAQRQNEDGSWSLEGHGESVVLRSDTAATGLCLLAFQGAGYTHRQHQYAATVARGLQFLLDRQRTNGDLFVPADAVSNRNVALYSHGIAALAMCEAYGMTQDPDLKGPAQMSIDYIDATQHRQLGGWRYTPQVSADTSVSGWMMMALKSGELAGLEVDAEVYDGIDRWLEQAKAGEGRGDRYRYNPFAPDTEAQRHGRDPTPTMTAVGMLMRMYAGWTPDHPAIRSAADYLLQYPPRNGTAASPQRDTYYWYYATQVMFQMGGDDWEAWNRELTPVLLETQIDEGEESGSWDPARPVPDRWSPHAGRLYVTTMNLLNLEVTYRHLPIYVEGWESN